MDGAALPYRCGGSTGFAPVSRFTRRLKGFGHHKQVREVYHAAAAAMRRLPRDLPRNLQNTPLLLDRKTFFKQTDTMNADFTSLEKKIERVVACCQSLRDENHALREHVALLERDKQALTEKIDTTRIRLEAFMERLPAE